MRRPLAPSPALLLLVATVLGGGPAAADGQGDPGGGGLAVHLAALDDATARDLEALAAWCQDEHAFGSRDDAYEVLLAFEPDHAEARKRLRWTRGEDGTWVRDPRAKRGTDWSRTVAHEAAQRLAKIQEDHRTARLDRCEAARDLGDLLLARRVVEAESARRPDDARAVSILRTLLLAIHDEAREKGLVADMDDAAGWLRAHHPQDIAVRAALGDVERGGRWMMKETARAADGAARLVAACAAALEAARPEAAEPRPVEAGIDLPWAAPRATPHVRVAGTADPAVLADVARRCEAAGPLFEAALGRAPVRREDFCVYVFGAPGEIDTFLEKYPVADNATLARRKEAGFDLVYADGRTLVLKDNPPAAQLDLATIEVLNQLLADTFLESATPRGWHSEGIARYLAWRLTGTRLSINVSGRYAGQGGDRHVPESGDPWLSRAHAALAGRAGLGATSDLDLELLLGKGTDVFEVRDALGAYAFAVYLLEAFDRRAADFVLAHAKTADADEACRHVLGMPRAIVEHRVLRWLEEAGARETTKR